MTTKPHPDDSPRWAAPDEASRVPQLRRTIAAERQLLVHPFFGVGAARVMVRARAEMRRIQRREHRRS